MTDVHVSACQ